MNKLLLASLSLSSVFLLSSCSGSSPAPWSRPDDSPWKDKRAAEAQAVPDDEIIYQPVTDPEPMPVETWRPIDEPPQPMMETIAIDNSMAGQGGMPMPEAVQAEVMVEEATVEDTVMSMPEGAYAVQVYAGKSEASIRKFQLSKGLDDLTMLKTNRGGEIFYVLVDLHDSRAAAVSAAAGLEQKVGSQPWVRSVAGLKKILVQ